MHLLTSFADRSGDSEGGDPIGRHSRGESVDVNKRHAIDDVDIVVVAIQQNSPPTPSLILRHSLKLIQL